MEKNKFHILVVDDDDKIRSLIKQFLSEKGFIISSAENAEKAKEKIEIFNFNLIILDVMMPGQSGYELTRELKESKNIPIICFPKGIGKNYIEFCNTVKPDCISIDYDVDPIWIRKNLENIPVQGGLDPKILLKSKEEVKKNTEKYLNTFKDYPYIFNLGHGVLPEIKPETIGYIVDLVRNKK